MFHVFIALNLLYFRKYSHEHKYIIASLIFNHNFELFKLLEIVIAQYYVFSIPIIVFSLLSKYMIKQNPANLSKRFMGAKFGNPLKRIWLELRSMTSFHCEL